jgi:hypothetical protein
MWNYCTDGLVGGFLFFTWMVGPHSVVVRLERKRNTFCDDKI